MQKNSYLYDSYDVKQERKLQNSFSLRGMMDGFCCLPGEIRHQRSSVVYKQICPKTEPALQCQGNASGFTQILRSAFNFPSRFIFCLDRDFPLNYQYYDAPIQMTFYVMFHYYLSFKTTNNLARCISITSKSRVVGIVL